MKIGVLGTGMVGNTIGSKLIQLGHEVKMGSRTATNEKAAQFVKSAGDRASQGTFADAAAFGELIFNCTSGTGSLDALKAAGNTNLKNKIIIDISNSLDFSKGMPPTLSIVNDNSLGEEIQKAFPESKVVKTLNTMNCQLMVDPLALNNGEHTVFMSGNDLEAKDTVKKMLNSFGWNDATIIDLGNITTARGTEQLLPMWVRLMGILGTSMFQFKIVK
jgi:predicted dinucleotide-binding enzyme